MFGTQCGWTIVLEKGRRSAPFLSGDIPVTLFKELGWIDSCCPGLDVMLPLDQIFPLCRLLFFEVQCSGSLGCLGDPGH